MIVWVKLLRKDFKDFLCFFESMYFLLVILECGKVVYMVSLMVNWVLNWMSKNVYWYLVFYEILILSWVWYVFGVIKDIKIRFIWLYV